MPTPRRAWPCAGAAVVCAIVVSACVGESGKVSLSSPGLGAWVVVAHRAPGISAMTEAEAAARHGQVIRYTSDAAYSGEEVCRGADYRESDVDAERFLASEFRLRPSDLGLEPSPDLRLRVVEVFCEGRSWNAMGGRVLWISGSRGFTVWDGVFFELRPASPGGDRS